MSSITTRAQRRQLARDNAKLPTRLLEVPREDWPDVHQDDQLLALFCSRDFLVQIFSAITPAMFRISVNRTRLDGERWADGITWDELQAIKTELGFGDVDAVELYPPTRDVVNVANIRHLWVLSAPMPFAWRRPAHADLTIREKP